MRVSPRHKIRLLALIGLLLSILMACGKNEFTLKGELSGGDASTIYMCWRATSKTRDFLATQAVPLTGSAFNVTGPVKEPTVIWVFSSGRSLLTAIYAERGDNLTLSGKFDAPGEWRVTGNDVMEEVSDWAKANRQVLVNGDTAAVNRAIADYVRQNPGSRSALFLLLTKYVRSGDDKTFNTLLSSFKDKEMTARMQAACLEPSDPSSIILPADRAKRINEVLEADSASSSPSTIASDSIPTD